MLNHLQGMINEFEMITAKEIKKHMHGPKQKSKKSRKNKQKARSHSPKTPTKTLKKPTSSPNLKISNLKSIQIPENKPSKSKKKPKQKPIPNLPKAKIQKKILKNISELQGKMQKVKQVRDELFERAAIVIQRAFRRHLRKFEELNVIEEAKNRDIRSLKSGENEIKSKVIIDIHTNQEGNYIHKQKRSKHNFSFGNNK